MLLYYTHNLGVISFLCNLLKCCDLGEGVGIGNTILAPPSPAAIPSNPLRRPQQDSLAALAAAMGTVFTPRRRQVGP
jgi:hypothetical protein